jgi:hypothetical protein
MKRLVSALITAVVVIGVLVLFIIFATHSGPGDSPRDSNNTKSPTGAAAGHVGAPSLSVRT